MCTNTLENANTTTEWHSVHMVVVVQINLMVFKCVTHDVNKSDYIKIRSLFFFNFNLIGGGGGGGEIERERRGE